MDLPVPFGHLAGPPYTSILMLVVHDYCNTSEFELTQSVFIFIRVFMLQIEVVVSILIHLIIIVGDLNN